MHNIRLDEIDEQRESRTFQAKKKRVFKLELTDGFKTVHGMEYTTIPHLNSKISPGAKLKIIGPLEVVNHILLLEPRSLKLMGGDVDHLLITNAYENVLLRALNKPTTNTPILDYKDEVLMTENNNVAAIPVASLPVHATTQRQVDDLLDGINFDDDEDVDMNMLNQIEQVERQNKSQENANPQPSIVIDDEDDAMLSQINLDEIERNSRSSSRPEAVQTAVTNVRVKHNDLLIPPIQIPDEYDDEEQDQIMFLSKPSTSRSAGAQDVCEYTDEPVPKKIARIGPTPIIQVSADIYKYKTTNGDNMVTVDQYLLLRSSEQMKRDYVIRGKINNPAMNTLRIKDSQWHLSVDMSDSYSYKLLPVKLHNKILEKLSGRSGSEIQNDYQEAKCRPQIKADIVKVLERLKVQLANLQGFMKIEIKMHLSQPNAYEVVELLEHSDEDDQVYRTKVRDEKLEMVG